MPLVKNVKSKDVRRRSINLTAPPRNQQNQHDMGREMYSNASEPVTVAIIGCGQRGTVSNVVECSVDVESD